MQPVTNTIITHCVVGTTRNILLGAGLCFAIQNEYYLHIPIILLTPSVYAGYHLYKNKERVTKWINENKK